MEQLSQTHRDILLLREYIQQHEHYYYFLKQPIITDFDYDILKNRLIELEKANPQYYCATSPLYRYVGLGRPQRQTIAHVQRLLEYEQGVNLPAIHDFVRRLRRGKLSKVVNYTFEPIIDGVDVELVYKSGVFARAVLQGNGREGIDVSQNVRALKGFRQKLYEDPRPCPQVLSIRAKFFVTKKELNEINFTQTREGERNFLSIRSLVKHLLLADDLRETTSAPLKYICIDILHGDEDIVDYTEIREALLQWRLPVNPVISDVEKSAAKGIEYRDNLLREHIRLPYHYTGVMIKAHETSIRDELGVSRTTVRWALKLLYPPIRKSSRVLEIIFDIDRRGVVSASARTEPIYFEGININVVRFEAVQDVQEKDIRVGDVVVIEREGERLPFVKERRLNADRVGPRIPTRVPTHCPKCKHELIVRRGALRCINTYDCPAQVNLRLMHFISEKGFNIRHLGPARCRYLVEQGIIVDFADLFQLKWRELVGMPHVKEGRAKMIIKEINRSKRVPLRNFLFALGIPEVGYIAAGELERVMKSIDEIRSASYKRLMRLRGVGPMAARSIYFYFREPDNLALINKMLDNGVVPYTANLVGHRRKLFYGKRIVLAGSLRKYRRKELTELIESEGGYVRTDIVRKADLLIHGRGGEEKLRLAHIYGVPDWNEAQLLRNLLKFGVG